MFLQHSVSLQTNRLTGVGASLYDMLTHIKILNTRNLVFVGPQLLAFVFVNYDKITVSITWAQCKLGFILF